MIFSVSSLVEDTLDSILGASDDEAEEDAVISQVLDEIGIEVTSKVCGLWLALATLLAGEWVNGGCWKLIYWQTLTINGTL